VGNEINYDVFWEGPFEWEKGQRECKDNHVLYQIYGSHHLYGRDVLLYIGSTLRTPFKRLREHEEWIEDEYDKMTFRFGSISEFTTARWEEQEKRRPYPRPKDSVIEAVEALLIYANQPAYNSRNKADAKNAAGIRIFNTGRIGHLLPEVSYKYFLGE
jgi:hypothetical protein